MKRKYRLKIKVTENDIKLQCKQYLSLKGYFHFYLTAGIASYKGAPDLVAIKNNRVLFLEIKRPGGRLSEHQQQFQLDIEGQGGEYYVVRCLDDLIKIIL